MRHLHSEPTVYLVPAWPDPDEQRGIFRECWPWLFEAMLKGWVTDPALWPSGRMQSMFEKWFEVEAYSIVKDIYQDEAIEYIDLRARGHEVRR